MGYTLWQRFQNWLCRRFGHRLTRSPQGDDYCRRCNVLVSTSWSRGELGKPHE